MNLTIKYLGLCLLFLVGCTGTSNQSGQSPNQNQAERPKKTITITSEQEIAYSCDPNQTTVRVLYGLSEQNVSIAQVFFQNTLTPPLYRIESDIDANTFKNQNYTWSTIRADKDNLAQAKGHVLSENVKESEDTPIHMVTQVKNCLVDARLSKRIAKVKNKAATLPPTESQEADAIQ